MLVELLMGLVVDTLVGSPVAVGRQFERDLGAYLDRRGLVRPVHDAGKPVKA